MVTLITNKTTNQTISLEEFLQLPETKPVREYFDNKMTQKPMSQAKHSRIQGKLTKVINDVVEESKIALAFCELRCTFNDKSIVPDIVVLTYDHIPRDENGELTNTISIPPDWMIEILSPDQSQTLIIKKILRCLESGCQLAWIIDPEEKIIFVYSPQKVSYFELDSDVLPMPDFMADFSLTLGDIFGWLKF